MVKTETKVIGDIRFTTTQLPAMSAYPLFIRLVKAIGPAAGILMTANQGVDLTKLMPVLSGALANLDTLTAEQIANEALACTTANLNGREIPLTSKESMNLVFTGKIKMLFQAITFAVSVNFADFTDGSDQAESPAPQQATSSSG